MGVNEAERLKRFQAMLDEPTAAMIDAGLQYNHRHNSEENMVASFKAMAMQAEIDSALSSTSEEVKP